MRLSDEQLQIQEATKGFLCRNYPVARVRSELEGRTLDRAFWSEVGAMGWLEILTRDAGADATISDLSLIVAEFGRALNPGTLIPSNLVLALLSVAADEAARQLEGEVASGAVTTAWCDLDATSSDADGKGIKLRPTTDGVALTGRVDFLLGGDLADMLVVSVRTEEGSSLLLVPADSTGVSATPLKTLDLTRNLSRVTFTDVIARPLAVSADELEAAIVRARQIGALLICADSLGAAGELLEMTVEYARSRMVFGRPIATYQAIKHRCADMLVRYEGSRLVTADAARALRLGAEDAASSIRLTAAYVGEACSWIAGEALQIFGGIGFTWEHDLHLYLRRIKVNEQLFGAPSEVYEELAVEAWGEAGSSHAATIAMDVRERHPELVDFRCQVRAFVSDQAPLIRARVGFRIAESASEQQERIDWRKKLFAAGFLGGEWPTEYGGDEDWTPARAQIVSEEVERAGLPAIEDQTHLCGYVISQFASPEQKAEYLPGIRDRGEVWCQLWSEPEAGSDLAALRTTARLEGDEFVVNGQKVWTSNAIWSDYGMLLARTDPEAPKHKGISVFFVDMKLPGVDIRPIREITGTSDFAEVFFDDVRVPASCLVGEINQGWALTIKALKTERSGLASGAARLTDALESLIETSENVRIGSRTAAQRDDVRDQISRFRVENHLCSLLAEWALDEAEDIGSPAAVTMGKLVYSEVNLRIAEYALYLEGLRGVLVEGDPGALEDGKWQDAFLYARAYTISGGSSEIMRNILAERVLGMPKDLQLNLDGARRAAT